MMKIKTLSDLPEVEAYLRRIGAEVRSLKSAVVKEKHGVYWKDIAIIHFNKDGSVDAPEGFEPTDAEKTSIEAVLLQVQWPKLKPLFRMPEDLPEEIAKAAQKDVFVFRDTQDRIIFVQVRKELPDGDKVYLPWTFWDDDEWRKTEPDGSLPLWGLDGLKSNTTVFLHEGAKAARAMREMVEAKTPAAKKKLAEHPWGHELQNAAHLGWVGGALSPLRTDWSELQRLGVKRAYIVSDNDAHGLSAVPKISRHLRMPTFHVQFTNEWPPSFDLADNFPPKMFAKIEGGGTNYIGPTFRACLHPATWATDLVPVPKGKPIAVLRDSFISMWSYVEEADLFACNEMPEILRAEAILNKIVAPFSHVSETSRLIVKSYNGRNTKLCYRPDIKGRVVTDRDTSAINLHVPGNIRSVPGDPAPFLEFMEYMFPLEHERDHALAWCATLIAHPEIRMSYGMLLVSESQGVGKTTLGSQILAPLVGYNNVSYPSENDITNSDFNGWAANKRLAIVNEIYSGHSWKAYNSLKSIITDTELRVNEKYQRNYTIENWTHVFACSNSLRALRMEDDDRRWLYPMVTEKPWPLQKFTEFRRWLQSGGLSIIKHWAEGYNNIVASGARAPMTQRKKDLIEGSRTDAQREAHALAEAAMLFDDNVAISMKEISVFVQEAVRGKIFDSDYELRKAMRDAGMRQWENRLKINGRLQHLMLTPGTLEKAKALAVEEGDAAAGAFLRGAVRKPSDILSPEM